MCHNLSTSTFGLMNDLTLLSRFLKSNKVFKTKKINMVQRILGKFFRS